MGIAFVLLLASARLGRANYVPNPRIVGNASDQWLFQAASDGVKAGAKTVTEKLLTNVARGLLNSLSAGLGDFILGRNRDLDRAVEIIVEEIRASHADLAARHRDLLEEVTAQFATDLIGDLNASSTILASWLASQDPLARQTSVDILLRPMADFERIRNVIEAYVHAGGSPEVLAQRLQLLPLHATAAQLAVIASRYYWATTALTTAFRRVHGADDSKFDAWVTALSAEDLACMEESTPQFRTFRNTVYDGTVEFYGSSGSRVGRTESRLRNEALPWLDSPSPLPSRSSASSGS